MPSKADVRKLLQFLDKDNSGKISTKELMDFLKEADCPLSKSQVEDFIKCHDKDGDGELNLDELVNLLGQ